MVTRDEDKARTRAALVDAGAAEFAERGFARARVEKIAARAGVTTGALYAHFRSKEDLFLAVNETAAAYTIKDMAELAGIALTEPAVLSGPSVPSEPAMLPEPPLDPIGAPLPDITSTARRPLPPSARTGLAGVADAWFARHTSDVGWFRLNVDFSLASVDNPQLHARLREFHQTARQWIGLLLEAMATRRGRRIRGSAERLAQTAGALGYGLVLEWIADPDSVPPDLFGDLLEELFLTFTEELPATAAGSDPATSDSEEFP